ncbi:MAG: sugar phosphate isomerase/epimerase [Planctomycetes bacterium]|nr:sugar phosphate isomerase/epimerase [Planctomycetota bacterium]
MLRSAVTISLVNEARGGPFVFWDDLAGGCRKAAELGFDAVEVFPPSGDAVDPQTLKKLLVDNRLTLAAVGTGAGWVRGKLNLTLPDAAKRAEARAFIKSIIDLAGPLGAPAIIGSMQGRHSVDGVDQQTARGWLSEALEELGDYARGYATPLIYEPLNRYETNMVNTVEQGVALLKSLNTKNVLLLADLFHMNIEEVDTAAALRAGRGLIGHVHFVDSNRRPAGNGHIDFTPIAAALKEIGYDRYISAEALPWPDNDTAAKQTIEAFRKFFPR